MDSFFKRVSAIQAELKAPKNQYNAFGRYKLLNRYVRNIALYLIFQTKLLT